MPPSQIKKLLHTSRTLTASLPYCAWKLRLSGSLESSIVRLHTPTPPKTHTAFPTYRLQLPPGCYTAGLMAQPHRPTLTPPPPPPRALTANLPYWAWKLCHLSKPRLITPLPPARPPPKRHMHRPHSPPACRTAHESCAACQDPCNHPSCGHRR